VLEDELLAHDAGWWRRAPEPPVAARFAATRRGTIAVPMRLVLTSSGSSWPAYGWRSATSSRRLSASAHRHDPLRIAALRIAAYTLWPFGATVVQRADAGPASRSQRPLVLFCGWWLALAHVVAGIALCLTIVGIPLGLACFKLVASASGRSAARSSACKRPSCCARDGVLVVTHRTALVAGADGGGYGRSR